MTPMFAPRCWPVTATLRGRNPSLHPEELHPQGKSLPVALGSPAAAWLLPKVRGVRAVLTFARAGILLHIHKEHPELTTQACHNPSLNPTV